jgi:peptide deformylase
MIHPILTHPDPVLRQVSTPVGSSNAAARQLLDDMLETMYGAQGRGLAAVQIGVLKRAVVIDVAWKEGAPQPLFLLDPEIVWASTEQAVLEERCLSIPNTPRTVERPAQVRVRYRDRDGVERTDDMSGMMAMVVQHEIDHLNGVLILDHLAPDAPAAS